MVNEMTTQEAINIMAEEAVRYRRLANDLADGPQDQGGRWNTRSNTGARLMRWTGW